MLGRAPACALACMQCGISSLPQGGHAFASGAVTAWMKDADPCIKQMCREMHGPLIERLLHGVGHSNTKVADMFREGAPLVGQLPTCTGDHGKKQVELDINELAYSCRMRNEETIRKIRQISIMSSLRTKFAKMFRRVV